MLTELSMPRLPSLNDEQHAEIEACADYLRELEGLAQVFRKRMRKLNAAAKKDVREAIQLHHTRMMLNELDHEGVGALWTAETMVEERGPSGVPDTGSHIRGKDEALKKATGYPENGIQVDNGLSLESRLKVLCEEGSKARGLEIESREEEVSTSVAGTADMEDLPTREHNRDIKDTKLADMESYANLLLQNLKAFADEGINKDKRLHRLTDELMRARLTAFEVIDDGELKSHWAGLQYRVEQWVATRCFSSATLTPSCQRHYASLLRRLSQNSLRFFKQESTRPLVLQAYVWNQLLRHVFGQSGQLWTSESLGERLGYLRYKLRESVESGTLAKKAFHEWRATTASLMHAATGTDTKRIGAIAAKIEDDLSLPSPPDQETGSRDGGETSPMWELVAAAVELDRRLVACRAEYCIYMYNFRDMHFTAHDQRDFCRTSMYGFGWSGNTMESALPGMQFKTGEKYRVAFTVAPALVKFGDHEGEGYETMQRIAKRRVLIETVVGSGGGASV